MIHTRLYPSLAVIVGALFTAAPVTSTPAGPLLKMLEEKKAKQAASGASTEPATRSSMNQVTPAAGDKDSKFENAKLKCKELGNAEGSNKYNSCVMTLME